MTNVINTTEIEFSAAAWEVMEEGGVNVDSDLDLVRRKGASYKADFLAHCLGGADADRGQGWRDYVDALFDAAEIDRELEQPIGERREPESLTFECRECGDDFEDTWHDGCPPPRLCSDCEFEQDEFGE